MEIKETNLNFSSLTPRSKVLEYIVVHHTASTSKETVEQIHYFHINNNGWAGIGYHFYIRKDGTIYRGRPEKYVGAHCEDYNSVSLGICCEGNFEIEQPTEKQLTSLSELLQYLKKKYGNVQVVGHRDLNATACPGKNLYSKMGSVIANAISKQDEYVKVFMTNNKLSVVLENGKKFTYSFTDKNELLRKMSIGLKITN
ncbi:N-acetylmuramoyl-L-alanine amidase [bacterium]|nr:N-acetylmuramoyl-L-alanine amidase [bacterium]